MGDGLSETRIGRGSLTIFLVYVTVFLLFLTEFFFIYPAPVFFIFFLGTTSSGAASAGSWPADLFLSIDIKWETVEANVQHQRAADGGQNIPRLTPFDPRQFYLDRLNIFPPERVYSHEDNINYLGEGYFPKLGQLISRREQVSILPECFRWLDNTLN